MWISMFAALLALSIGLSLASVVMQPGNTLPGWPRAGRAR